MALRFDTIDSITRVSSQAWNALVDAAAPPTSRWEWLFAMEESKSATAERGWQPNHLLAWQGDVLVAAAPAYLKLHSMGEYVYDFGWAQAASQLGVEYYPKLLVNPPLAPLTGQRFLGSSEACNFLVDQAIAYARRERLSSVHAIFLPDNEAQQLEQRGYFRRRTLQYHWRNAGYATYDDFLARFDSKRRHQLKRERAAASSQGITLRTLRGNELDTSHARLAYRFYESTCEKNGWGQVQLTPEFFELVFKQLPDHVEMVLAERHGHTLAGAFNLSTATHLYGRYWGTFEEHPFLHFNVCFYHSIDDCIRAGRQVFEPGAGGEHKVSRGFAPTAIHSAHWVRDERLATALRRFCTREGAQVDDIASRADSLMGMRPTPG